MLGINRRGAAARIRARWIFTGLIAGGAAAGGSTRSPWLVLCAAMTVAACHPSSELPTRLSDWHQLSVHSGRLVLAKGVVPFDLNTPLFSDYAHKLRTIWLPRGMHAERVGNEVRFPVGTVFTKTFFYPTDAQGRMLKQLDMHTRTLHTDGEESLDLSHVKLIETRLLIHRPEGWLTLAYQWNEAQTRAVLRRTGALVPLELHDAVSQEVISDTYLIPNQLQCGNCHNRNFRSGQSEPLGPRIDHLDRDYDYASGRENQLLHLTRIGYLTGLDAAPYRPDADWEQPSARLEDRARAYLDVNCGHCHNPGGAAANTTLFLDAAADPSSLHYGICKRPIAAGRATGGRLMDIVAGEPDHSIMLFRIASTEPGVMMPEIGRGIAHAEGIALIRSWIASLSQQCSN
jgi:uncharacterized repeat protein (TIGR03806 family)